MNLTVPGQFESVEHAIQTHAILRFAKHATDIEHIGYVLLNSAMERVKAEAARQFASASKSYPSMDCQQCRVYSVFGGPKHNGSASCKRGKSHCSCSLCW